VFQVVLDERLKRPVCAPRQRALLRRAHPLERLLWAPAHPIRGAV